MGMYGYKYGFSVFSWTIVANGGQDSVYVILGPGLRDEILDAEMRYA